LNTSKITLTSSFLFGFLYLLVFLVLFWSASTISDHDIQIEVEAKIERGNIFQAFINSDAEHPASVLIASGRVAYKIPYSFQGDSASNGVRRLRLDFTHMPAVPITVYRIRILDGKSDLFDVTGAEFLQRSANIGITDISINEVDKSASFVSTTGDPIVALDVDVSLPGNSWQLAILKLFKKHFLWYVSLLGIFFVFLVEVISAPRGRWRSTVQSLFPLLFLLGIPTSLDLYISIFSASTLAPHYESVGEAVGFSIYHGDLKPNEFTIFYGVVLAAVLIGGLVGFIYKRVNSNPIFERCQPNTYNNITEGKVPSVIILLSLVFLITIIFCPNLKAVFEDLSRVSFFHNWDSINIEGWNYLNQLGFKVFRDYWFPYGSSGFLLSRDVTSLFLSQLHRLIIFLFLGSSLFYVFNRSYFWPILSLLLLILLKERELLSALDRYLMSVSLVLGTSAFLFNQRSNFMGVILGLFAAYVFIVEPSQCVYAFIGVVFLLSVYLGRAFSTGNLKGAFSYLLVPMLSLGISLFIYLYYLQANNQLIPFFETYLRLSSCKVYCSTVIPGGIASWFRNQLSIDGMAVLSTLVCLSCGIFWSLTEKDKKNVNLGFTIVAVSLACLMIYQKQIVRPHVLSHFSSVIVINGLLAIFLLSQKFSIRQKVILYVWVYCVFSMLGPRPLWDHLINTPLKMSANFDLISMRDKSKEVYQDLFTEQRLGESYPLIKSVSSVLQQLKGASDKYPSFYILGDDSYVYHVFRQTPPKFTNIYNTSNIEDQKELVEWLVRSKPELIIWPSSFVQFDNVPNVVRAPIIYKYVVDNYEPFLERGSLVFLRGKNKKELNVEFWKGKLGKQLDLGGVPGASSLGGFPECRYSSVESLCVPVVEVKLKMPVTSRQQRVVRFSADNFTFDVVFKTLPGVQSYFIRTDRLWFWNFSSDWKITRGGGRRLNLTGRALNNDILY
jgi:hypothetical protein